MKSSKPRPGRESRMDRAIEAILVQPNLQKAAATAGISYSTLWRLMQQEDFNVRLREANRQVRAQYRARLHQASPVAVTVLLRVMTDQNTPPASQVRAANSVLHHGKAVELEDLLDRVSDLEKTIKKPEEGAE